MGLIGRGAYPMWQIVIVALGHLLILFLALLGLRRLHRYTASRFIHSTVHCPTELAAKGQYEAPPRGWTVLYLIIHLIIPRLIFLTATIGSFLLTRNNIIDNIRLPGSGFV